MSRTDRTRLSTRAAAAAVALGCAVFAGSCAKSTAPPAVSADAPASVVAGPVVGEVDLLGVHIIDAKNAWAVGDIAPGGGAVLYSPDAGVSWRPIARTTEVLSSVWFVDTRRGWVAGYAGRIERTDDGGATWAKQRTEREGEVLNSISFVDPDRGWAVGGSGLALRTSDGGATWTPVPTRRDEDFWAVRFATPERGWIVGEDGLVLATDDAGGTWRVEPSGTTAALTSLDVVSPACVVAVGEHGTILRSADGAAWTAVASGTTETLNAVASAGPTFVWAVGARGTSVVSTDGGATWTAGTAPGAKTMLAVDVADVGPGLAVGRRGATERVDRQGSTK